MAKKFDVVDTLEKGFGIFWKEPRFMIFFLLPTIILLGMMAILGASLFYGFGFEAAPSPFLGTAVIAYVVVLIAVIFVLFSWGAAAAIIKADAILRKKKMPVTEAFSLGLRKVPKLILTTLITTGIVMAGCIALIIPGIYLMARLLLAQQACVLDRKGLGIMSSWNATRGNFWRLFALVLLLGIISAVVSFIPVVGAFISYLVITPVGMICYVMVYRKLK